MAFLIEFVNVMGWDTFALVGHSKGAGYAAMLAGSLKSRITSLVLIDGLHYPSTARRPIEGEHKSADHTHNN